MELVKNEENGGSQSEKAPIFSISDQGQLRDMEDDSLTSRYYRALGLGSKFTKLAVKKSGVLLQIEENIDENNTKDVAIRSAENPHEDFTNALAGIIPLVRHILELPDGYATKTLNIGSVAFSYSKDKEIKGVVISGWINLDTTNSPFFFNTPYLPYAGPNEESTVPVVPDFGVEALNLLEKEAVAYMEGKRAQLSLPLD